MSQLRNLLTNKVIAHKSGNMAKFRRHLRAHGRNLKSVRAEITERAELRDVHKPVQSVSPVQMIAKCGGLIRRVGNFLSHAFKGN